MYRRHRTIFASAAILGGMTACQGFRSASDIQTAQIDEARYSPRSHWRDMADNALLQDMSLADVHFVSHSGELNGTGAARLDRLSPLLDVYGGTVRYETELTDDEEVAKRLEHISEFLATTGCNMDRVQIEAMMSGGRGMSAKDAIQARDRTFPSGPSAAGARPQPGPMQAGGGAGGSGHGTGR
jgi:hypothetical protein